MKNSKKPFSELKKKTKKLIKYPFWEKKNNKMHEFNKKQQNFFKLMHKE